MVASASSGGHGLARTADDLAALDAPGVLGPDDRKALGLAPGEAAASLSRPGATLKAYQALHLGNRALAVLGYGVDPGEPRASSLTEADFLRLGIKVTDLPLLSRGANDRIEGGIRLFEKGLVFPVQPLAGAFVRFLPLERDHLFLAGYAAHEGIRIMPGNQGDCLPV